MRMSFARGVPVVAVSLLMVGAVVAGDAVESGLKAGSLVAPFDVEDITGPNKGKTLCYR